jgi:hypothetical protein
MIRLSVLACVAFVLATATPATGADPTAWNATWSAGLAQISESTASLPVNLDADGDIDLIWNRHAKQSTQLFYNDGFGHFTERFAGVLAARVDRHQCAAADVDRNGYIDVYCVIGANYGTSIKANELWMQQATGGFVNKATEYGVLDRYGRGRTATFLDVNDDGWQDLYVVNFYPRPDGQPTKNRLYINLGGTSFRSAPEYGLDEQVGGLATIPGCVQAVDYDRDGDEDILDCAAGGLRLYRYDRAAAHFSNVAPALGIGSAVADAEIADLNADGVLDILTLARWSLTVRYGTGNGTFTGVKFSRALTAGRDAAVGHSNRDGRLDIYVMQGQSNPTLLNPPDVMLLSTASSWVSVGIPQTTAGCGSSVAVLDFDANGLDDYLVSNGARGVAGPTMLIAFR